MPGFNNTREDKNKAKRFGRKKPMVLIDDPEEGQEFAIVEKELGNCHFIVKTLNELTYTASLTGNVKKSGRVLKDDLVLIEPLTENNDGKYIIVCKYTHEQRKMLEKKGKIIKKVNNNPQQQEQVQPQDDGFVFEDDVRRETERDQLQMVEELFGMNQIDDM
jgi:initiation factor 1A